MSIKYDILVGRGLPVKQVQLEELYDIWVGGDIR